MINDDVLVKFSRRRLQEGHTLGLDPGNWPDYTRFLKKQILDIKLGFPGIGDNDLNILDVSSVTNEKRYIFSDNLDSNCGQVNTDHAPILGFILDIDEYGNATVEIEGIGSGLDFTRDPDRFLRWGQRYVISLRNYSTLLEVTSKPRPDGGSVYYYFNKHPRDSRW